MEICRAFMGGSERDIRVTMRTGGYVWVPEADVVVGSRDYAIGFTMGNFHYTQHSVRTSTGGRILELCYAEHTQEEIFEANGTNFN